MEALPLAGRRIVITRASVQASALRRLLEELGAEVIEIPTIEIRDPDSWAPLDTALRRIDQFDFLILTSVNGVKKLLQRLAACGRTPQDLAPLQVGAIGPATASELTLAGVNPALSHLQDVADASLARARESAAAHALQLASRLTGSPA